MMQTFLPYEYFPDSAECLDNKRLGKQRVECKQLINALRNGGGWANHPAAKMWRGYETALALYGMAVCEEWVSRGYRDSLWEFFNKIVEADDTFFDFPPWLGNKAFHDSHRSNLLRKDPHWYGQWGWDVPTDLPYVWPVLPEVPPR